MRTIIGHNRREGLTALHSAAYRGHLQVISALLAAGADPGICGYENGGSHAGRTARDVAMAQGQRGAAELLERRATGRS